jgi:hypothetical protein
MPLIMTMRNCERHRRAIADIWIVGGAVWSRIDARAGVYGCLWIVQTVIPSQQLRKKVYQRSPKWSSEDTIWRSINSSGCVFEELRVRFRYHKCKWSAGTFRCKDISMVDAITWLYSSLPSLGAASSVRWPETRTSLTGVVSFVQAHDTTAPRLAQHRHPWRLVVLLNHAVWIHLASWDIKSSWKAETDDWVRTSDARSYRESIRVSINQCTCQGR